MKTTQSQSADGETPVSELINRGREIKDLEPESKPEPDIYDPYAPENLRLPQDYQDQIITATLLNTIPVQKPSDQEFVRVHPSEDYRLKAALITHQDERGARYFVHPTFLPHIGTIKYHLEQLYLYTSRQGKLAFWPIKVQLDNRENTWLQSSKAAAESAMKMWVCITSNVSSKMYVASKALGIFPEPDWAKITQGKDVFQLIKIAFEDRFILDGSHPLIKKLRGLE